MDTDSLITCIKTEDIYLEIPKDVLARVSNTSNYKLEIPLTSDRAYCIQSKDIQIFHYTKNKVFHLEFLADLAIFTEETLNGKLHFFAQGFNKWQ